MKNDIEQEVVALEEELKQFKASQMIGGSNSMVYQIVKDVEFSFTIPANSYRYVIFTFTSNVRPFPRMCVKVSEAKLDGVDILSSLHITSNVARNYWEQPSLYTTRLATSSFSYSSSQRNLTIKISVLADTSGTIDLELGS